jgi:hypothetical protein
METQTLTITLNGKLEGHWNEVMNPCIVWEVDGDQIDSALRKFDHKKIHITIEEIEENA